MTVLDPVGRQTVVHQSNVSRETLARLDALTKLFSIWRSRLNLMGPREYDRIWSRHINDSLQLLPHISSFETAIDLGSGGGFPALVLAAAAPEPFSITLVESVAKKCTFLAEAIETIGLSAQVHNGRVEDMTAGPVDVITARAFAPLPKLLNFAEPWFEFGAIGLFHKGKSWQEELNEVSRQWALTWDAIPSRTDPDGVILKILEVRRNG
ncbi:MAG: 16S rRNA (guanine(527)-N(7))-methyltransferase RsmG [Pseudomonadota bacterium]